MLYDCLNSTEKINTIGVNVIIDREWRFARYIVRQRTQTYTLSLTSEYNIGSGSGTVAVLLTHCGNNHQFTTALHNSKEDGLGDGSHITKKLVKAMDLPVKKVANDQVPSTPASPVYDAHFCGP